MRVTRLVTRTLRTEPAEAETASHRLMLRAGLISPVAAGVYSYLPLGLRSRDMLAMAPRNTTRVLVVSSRVSNVCC